MNTTAAPAVPANITTSGVAISLVTINGTVLDTVAYNGTACKGKVVKNVLRRVECRAKGPQGKLSIVRKTGRTSSGNSGLYTVAGSWRKRALHGATAAAQVPLGVTITVPGVAAFAGMYVTLGAGRGAERGLTENSSRISSWGSHRRTHVFTSSCPPQDERWHVQGDGQQARRQLQGAVDKKKGKPQGIGSRRADSQGCPSDRHVCVCVCVCVFFVSGGRAAEGGRAGGSRGCGRRLWWKEEGRGCSRQAGRPLPRLLSVCVSLSLCLCTSLCVGVS